MSGIGDVTPLPPAAQHLADELSAYLAAMHEKAQGLLGERVATEWMSFALTGHALQVIVGAPGAIRPVSYAEALSLMLDIAMANIERGLFDDGAARGRG